MAICSPSTQFNLQALNIVKKWANVFALENKILDFLVLALESLI